MQENTGQKNIRLSIAVLLIIIFFLIGAVIAGTILYYVPLNPLQDDKTTLSNNVTTVANTSSSNNVSNTAANTVANTTGTTGSTKSSGVTLKGNVLTDTVAGYTMTLPPDIADAHVLTSDGPKLPSALPLRYLEMTGSPQDYAAVYTLGLAQDGASFSPEFLTHAVGVPVNVNAREFVPVAGYKVAKTEYKSASNVVIYVNYSVKEKGLTLKATLFNPGQLSAGLISDFEKALMSITLTK